MDKNIDQRAILTRTCSVCGLEKPLSAFLEITAAHGTTYGTICAPCRSNMNAEKARAVQTDDDRTTAFSGARIGAKEKIFHDKAQLQKLTEVQELYKEDLKKQETLQDKKISHTLRTERLNREATTAMLDARQRQLFNTSTSDVSAQKQKERGVPQSVIQREAAQRNQQAQGQVEANKQFLSKEERANTIDFSTVFIAPTTFTLKFSSVILQAFYAWLGPEMLARTMERIENHFGSPAATSTIEKATTHFSTFAHDSAAKKGMEPAKDEKIDPANAMKNQFQRGR